MITRVCLFVRWLYTPFEISRKVQFCSALVPNITTFEGLGSTLKVICFVHYPPTLDKARSKHWRIITLALARSMLCHLIQRSRQAVGVFRFELVDSEPLRLLLGRPEQPFRTGLCFTADVFFCFATRSPSSLDRSP